MTIFTFIETMQVKLTAQSLFIQHKAFLLQRYSRIYTAVILPRIGITALPYKNLLHILLPGYIPGIV